MKRKRTVYEVVFKRPLDFILSLVTIIILLPFFIIFTPIVAIAMKGNPFFVCERPGRKCKLFKLIKFRSMTNERDEKGKLLTDIERLTKFGKFLRKTSIDELPSLFNILVGHLSIVGPRPLAVSYLPYYTKEENRRHSVRPGLTGLAQIKGRNNLNWEERFSYDIDYVDNLTFWADVRIIFKTIGKVFRREDITVRGTTELIDFHIYRMNKRKEENK